MSVAAFINEHEGKNSLSLLVEGVHCAACIRSIEGEMQQDPLVQEARLNLSLRRLSLQWSGPASHGEKLASMVENLGYRVSPFDPAQLSQADENEGRTLLRSLAIAAFASSNVMMLSLAVWVGQFQDMAPDTQRSFQWVAGLVAVPATLFAGQVFFRSAWQAVRRWRTNIDVPISLGILLTTFISLLELWRGGSHVYFDSAVALLFVLLIGRYLDFRVRARARSSIEQLLLVRAYAAHQILPDGSTIAIRADQVTQGMTLLVPPGARFPVDSVILSGHSTIDRSVVTGESKALEAGPGDTILSGSVNGGAALQVEALAAVDASHLAQIAALVENAEKNRSPLVVLGDRAAALWTPFIHGTALITLIGWLLAGAGLPVALLNAVCVLIVACPCAIGLAVPAVQTVASGALFKRGILLRSGEALERLARVDQVAFDKTGTLTHGSPIVVDAPCDQQLVAQAASIAKASGHPLARAIAALSSGPVASNVIEHAGLGLSQGSYKLGSARFCQLNADDMKRDAHSRANGTDSIVWFTHKDQAPGLFRLRDAPRPEASAAVQYFTQQNIQPHLLSGDTQGNVSSVAATVKIKAAQTYAEMLPADKLRWLEQRAADGHRTLMVGDGVNDAPALAGAWVSAGFSYGAPISQNRADIILPEQGIGLLPFAHRVARKAYRLILQNFGLALAYNIILMPLAMAGALTPLKAAIAMSVSSLTVTLNALRAGRVPLGAAA